MGFCGFFSFSQPSDLRQELAVRERQQEVTRKSAPSSPTLDCEKMDSAVQASLSLPATPVGKGSENSFPSPKGIIHRDVPLREPEVGVGMWISHFHEVCLNPGAAPGDFRSKWRGERTVELRHCLGGQAGVCTLQWVPAVEPWRYLGMQGLIILLK